MNNEQFTINELDAFCKLNKKSIEIQTFYSKITNERVVRFSINDDEPMETFSWDDFQKKLLEGLEWANTTILMKDKVLCMQ